MKVEAIVPTTQVVDILCDVCGSSTTTTIGTQEFGTLAARSMSGCPKAAVRRPHYMVLPSSSASWNLRRI